MPRDTGARRYLAGSTERIAGVRCGHSGRYLRPAALLALAVIQRALDDIALRRSVRDEFNVHPWAWKPQEERGGFLCVEEVLEWLNSENCEFWCDVAGISPDEVAKEAVVRMVARNDAVWVM